jgi:hypothetical protein
VLWLDADAQEPNLEVWLVDLKAGWEAFEHSIWTRKWRETDVAFSADRMSPTLAATDPTALETLLQDSIEARVAQKPNEGFSEAYRAWLQGRIDVIGRHSAEAKDMLVCEWPIEIPTLRKSNEHTDDELAQVERLLDLIEGRFWMPFPAPKPTPPSNRQPDKGAKSR